MTNLQMLHGWGRDTVKTRKMVSPIIAPTTVDPTPPEEVTDDVRTQILIFIKSRNHRPAKEAYKEASQYFGLSTWHIRKLWIREVLSRIEEKQSQQI